MHWVHSFAPPTSGAAHLAPLVGSVVGAGVMGLGRAFQSQQAQLTH